MFVPRPVSASVLARVHARAHATYADDTELFHNRARARAVPVSRNSSVIDSVLHTVSVCTSVSFFFHLFPSRLLLLLLLFILYAEGTKLIPR